MKLPIKTREELDAVIAEMKRKKSLANKLYYARHYAKPEKKKYNAKIKQLIMPPTKML